MTDAGGGEPGPWQNSYLVLAAMAVLSLLTVALSGTAAVQVALAAAVLCTGLALYFAAPRRVASRAIAAKRPEQDFTHLPVAARNILECVDEPLLLLDQAGRVVFANRASQSLVGPDAEKKRLASVLRTPSVLESVERVLGGGEAETVAFSVLVPVQRHYEAYVTRTGNPLILLRVRDLTALRRTEELRADFVANASHELRTPLAAVTGFIDTLRGHAKNDPDARDRFLDIMSQEAGRMGRLIEELLSLTRIELNEHNPPEGHADVAAILRDTAAVLAPLAAADRVAIRIEPKPAVPVIGDRDELTQVFQNLLHNAIKYGRQGGEVRVRFGTVEPLRREAAGQVSISIHDQGEGIPREAIPRLTERFYRVDIGQSRASGGTGLGLAIVKHILNRHNGRLHVESTPGEGSTFTVYLPAAPQQLV